jgi:(1->4)-alpha-D-glucan 1-alpha-D-glucosylmutase
MRPAFPSATYRLQLTPSFGFEEVRRLLPYLERLGVDTLYLSPILAARSGSQHGYDGIDPGRVDSARGGQRGFDRLARSAERRGMRLLLDIVPNHLAASLENPAWREVLRCGPGHPLAPIFDIDWHRTPDGHPAVVLPWLDRPLREAFVLGRLKFEFVDHELVLRSDHGPLPTSSRSRRRWSTWRRSAPPGGDRTDLARLSLGGTPTDFARRQQLLADQWYRLVPWWDFAAINYRRFFDVSELVGVRSDRVLGFEYTHRWLRRAVRSPAIVGVRVDHVDGLEDPARYLRRLGRMLANASTASKKPYVVVEKILAHDESLPEDWEVAGTTGYEALDRMTEVLIAPDSFRSLDRAYRTNVAGAPRSYRTASFRAKREVAERSFPAERGELARRLAPRAVSADSRTTPALDLEPALVAATSALGVYRTYAVRGRRRPSDDAAVRAAVERARRVDRRRAVGAGLDAFERAWASDPPDRRPRREFVPRWQQWSSALAAKGGEDTALYRFPRALALNEVGSDPDHLSCSLSEFHRFMADRALRWRHALTATSTHDTKWGEDARARLIALSEWPAPWGRDVGRWRCRNRRFREGEGRGRGPSPAEEYRLYQTLLATWPGPSGLDERFVDRMLSHTEKAAREAKLGTSWTRPNPEFEEGLRRFVRALLTDPRAEEFREEMSDWADRIAYFAAYYSLIQVVLRITVPGVPDLYQGSEGWNLSLVDPDNRRDVRFSRFVRWAQAVDFHRARTARGPPRERDKFELTARLLRFRREHPATFGSGSYLPLGEATGGPPAPVLAFARTSASEGLIVVVGRGLARTSRFLAVPPLGPLWGPRRLILPSKLPRRWNDLVSGRPIRSVVEGHRVVLPLKELFGKSPMAVLHASARGG